MTMLRTMGMLVLMILLDACAGATSEQWHKSGVSRSQIDFDLASCKHEADIATVPITGAAVLEGTTNVRLRNDCMTLRGYRLQ